MLHSNWAECIKCDQYENSSQWKLDLSTLGPGFRSKALSECTRGFRRNVDPSYKLRLSTRQAESFDFPLRELTVLMFMSGSDDVGKLQGVEVSVVDTSGIICIPTFKFKQLCSMRLSRVRGHTDHKISPQTSRLR